MTMAPSAPEDKQHFCTAQHHSKYRATVCHGGNTESIPCRFFAEGMASDDFSELRPENDPCSVEHDDSWLHLRLGSSEILTCTSTLQSSRPLDQRPAPDIKWGQMPMTLNESCRLRIIRPPRQPDVGIWFMLQASQNQVVEPILPQIPQAYLRIKDGRMTVRLLKKYLAHKLTLQSESEVVIRCRGKELQPGMTMQYARDNIWCREIVAANSSLSTPLLSSSPTAGGTEGVIMILLYARGRTISIHVPDDGT